MIRFLVILGIVSSLSACDSPAPEYLGGPVQDVTVDDTRFRIYMQHGSRGVEAHRVSLEALPSLVLTFEKAYRAIEIATGCHIIPNSMTGDQAIIRAKVDCLLL